MVKPYMNTYIYSYASVEQRNVYVRKCCCYIEMKDNYVTLIAVSYTHLDVYKRQIYD